jgi:hypothetical protein
MSGRRDVAVPAIGLALAALGVLHLSGRGPAPLAPWGRSGHEGGESAASGSAPVNAELLALLEGLDTGSTIAGWTVVGLRPAAGGEAVRIELEREGLATYLQVQRKHTSSYAAPAASELHEIFYGRERRGRDLPPEVLQPLLDATVDLLRGKERGRSPAP